MVDSREASVFFAKSFFIRSGIKVLGPVEHIRVVNFADRFAAFLNMMNPGDVLLVAVHYLSRDQLEKARLFLRQGAFNGESFSLASFDCFDHMKKWCDDIGCHFDAIPYKRRTLSGANAAKISTGRRKVGPDYYDIEDIERIWIQYRLILAIVSRSASLSDVSRQLILGQPVSSESIDNEYKRAVRYFQMGEPDMAGGSYSCEQADNLSPIDELRLSINKIAVTDFNVLIRGESGSGKEIVAWAIHELSSRRDQPYITINCAGLPEELLESELFGYVKGSHTLAYEDSPGLLGVANGGTVFLDELPDMGARIQSKLLRFLESGEYRPLGGLQNLYTDVRIIAAGQPERLTIVDRVRPDLRNRIGQLDVFLLPLRKMEKNCPGTISKIAYILLERLVWTSVYREGRVYELTPRDIKDYQDELSLPQNVYRISNQDWKESNSRELINFLRRWMVFGDDELRRLDDTLTHAEINGAQNNFFCFPNDALSVYFEEPSTRSELKTLLAKKPFHHLKRIYVRHLFEVYSRIVETENELSETPKKATQKELAKLMGVTDNTISRYLN